MVIYWNDNTKALWQAGKPWQLISTVEPELDDVTIYRYLAKAGQPMTWQDNTKAHWGQFGFGIAGSTASPQATLMAMDRSIMRRVHSRVFGRVN